MDNLSRLSTSSSFSGHYNPRNDVILTLETITARETKILLFDIRLTVAVASVAVILLTYFKLSQADNFFLKHNRLVLLNVAGGGICLAILLYCSGMLAYHIYAVSRLKKYWAPRRKYVVCINTLEVACQSLNLIFFVSANVYVLATGCTWFSNTVRWLSFAQWTCWNTTFLLLLVMASNSQPWLDKEGNPIGRPDATLTDAPITVHAPKLILWIIFEVCLLLAYTHIPPTPPRADTDGPFVSCLDAHYSCGTDRFTTAMTAICVSVIILILLTSLVLVLKSLRRVMGKPYEDYRMANIALRLQVRLRGPAVLLYSACIVCLALVRVGSCTSLLFTWLGMFPMQLVQSTIAAVAARMMQPRCLVGSDDVILQVWLQEHAWCERDIERRKAIRRSSVPGNQSLDNEPMFCFETALKMHYWSSLVYSFQEAEDPKATDMVVEARSLDVAMSLYNLKHFELIWEKKLDTKCLVAWNEDTVVVSFRGTASMANACSDIKFWWSTHPPARGSYLLFDRPMVHTGFLDSWLANGLNLRVVECINRVVNAKGTDRDHIKVLITGHSLGGALATLAAYHIRQGCGLGAHNVFCTTFGAPRTGNHAFAWDYNSVVPHTWHIINDQDLVTRKGKVFIMYKRPGQRVLISRLGDLIVRPSWIEVSIRQRGNGSVAQHLLASYQAALVAVCTAQFTKKGSRRGMQGILDLMQDGAMQKILAVAGVDRESLQRMERLAKLTRHKRKALAKCASSSWCPTRAVAAAAGVSPEHAWKPTRLRRLDEDAAAAAVAAADSARDFSDMVLDLEDFDEASGAGADGEEESSVLGDGSAAEQQKADVPDDVDDAEYEDGDDRLPLHHAASLDQATDTGYQDRCFQRATSSERQRRPGVRQLAA
ncbi:hypothetical protein WJX72_009144 [[Myrmecia] bisecta]|uniref:Fungal lipase-type domain-containing protein n=1 Tax=[Myrmecia] bisecta TaxID=41462 RepID=A0AAW1Q1J2_9CHLO